MVRKFIVAAALATGGLLATAPSQPASAGVSIGVGVGGPGYYGYAPIYHRGYRHGYRRGYHRHYGYYAPRYSYRPYRARPRCRIVTDRYWNGYRYKTRTVERCRRW